MAGLFAGINMSAQSLRSFQRALETSGHNIANVNTPGYSRQRVEFGTLDPKTFWERGFRAVGQGTQITSIGRIRDGYLEASLNSSNGQMGRYSTLTGTLSQVERIMDEPSDNGIANALNKFFDGWSGLASNPGDSGSRLQLRSAAQTLADRIRGNHETLSNLKVQSDKQIGATFDEIDRLAQEIASLNGEIRHARATAGEPNDVLDQRDQAIARLSQLVNVTTETFEDGSTAVYAAGHSLVDGYGARPFPRTYDATAGTVTDGSLTYQVRTGELLGHFQGQVNIEGQMAALDDLANALRDAFNDAHALGMGLNGSTGISFFTPKLLITPNGAADFDLDVQIKNDVQNIAAGMSGEPGDGSLALSFAAVRDQGAVSLGGKSIVEFYQEKVQTSAAEQAFFLNGLETERSIQEQIKNQIQAVSGVNIDDEMADMLRFQRSYQAAARALTVFDQMSEDLIGMLRR